jgi:hypothetical protein
MTDFLFNIHRQNSANPSGQSVSGGLPLPPTVSQAAYISKDVLPGRGGRLHYLSTEWGARSIDNSFIPEGSLVRPMMRQGNTWFVAVDEQNPPKNPPTYAA